MFACCQVVEALNSYLRRAYGNTGNSPAAGEQQSQQPQQSGGRASKKGATASNASNGAAAGSREYAAGTLGQDRTAWPPRTAGPGSDTPVLPQLPICSVLCPSTSAPSGSVGAGVGRLSHLAPTPQALAPGRALAAAGSAEGGAADGASDVRVLAMRLVRCAAGRWQF